MFRCQYCPLFGSLQESSNPQMSGLSLRGIYQFILTKANTGWHYSKPPLQVKELRHREVE